MVPAGQNGSNMAQLQRVTFAPSSVDPNQQLTLPVSNGGGGGGGNMQQSVVTSPNTNGHHSHNNTGTNLVEQQLEATTPNAPMSTGENSQASDEPEEEEEPLYVNAKQYNRILKRRMARAKLENDGRIPRTRQVFIYYFRIPCFFFFKKANLF